MSEPLDFERPLWQLYLVEGLEGGRHAYISKTHHALVDGVSAVDVGTILLDPNPEGTEMPIPEERWDPDVPSPELLFVRAATGPDPRAAPAARKAALGAITHARARPPAGVMRTARGVRRAGRRRARPRRAPSSTSEIGRDRRVAFVRTELDALKQARGDDRRDGQRRDPRGRRRGLRPPLRAPRRGGPRPARRARPGEHPPARTSTWSSATGSRRSWSRCRSSRARPGGALGRIHAETARLKQSEQARAASLVIEATGWTPPTINRVLSEAMSRPLIWNLVVSNVPGPQMPFYLLGRRMRRGLPVRARSPPRATRSRSGS